jgi:predicted O-linked N-acetylglucosamine transferase (SPINDLY family)
LEAAVALAPDAATLVALLGGLLARANRLREADRLLERAAELLPEDPSVRNDRAAVLIRLHRHAEAASLLRGLLQAHGPSVGVLCNLGTAVNALGDQTEAARLARQAIDLAPDQVLPWRTLANVLPYTPEASATELADTLGACARRLPRGRAHRFTNLPDPLRRLRLGVLSGSLRTHPVGWLTVAGFEALDPAQFELVCLVQAAAEDALAQRFRSRAAVWVEIDCLDDAALADAARSHGIDVLIDLGGYGDLGRLPACASRLAPVQVKWVGMQTHSTGLPEIDWIVADRWETPPDLEHLYSERPLRLADGYVCYTPPAYAPAVGPAPFLSRGRLTFGCFNNLAKISPPVVATWSRVLRAAPTAQIVLKTHQFSDAETCARLLALFGAYGVAAERIELRGASGHREFLRQYNDIDIALDPFPYSGGLTTCEALWMGVPTLTVPGQTFASRHSASHMSNVGLADWVVDDLNTYVARAVESAEAPMPLAELRAGLRARVKASPLCDAPRFGRSLGAALRHAWQDWCSRQASSLNSVETTPH